MHASFTCDFHMHKEPEFLTCQEAANYLGLARSRVQVLSAEGRIGKKIGPFWVYTRRELAAFARQKRPSGVRRKKTRTAVANVR